MKNNKLPFIFLIFPVFLGIGVSNSLFSQWEKETVGPGALGSIAVDPQGGIHLCYLTASWEADLVYACKRAETWVMDTLVHSGIVSQCDIVADNLSPHSYCIR